MSGSDDDDDDDDDNDDDKDDDDVAAEAAAMAGDEDDEEAASASLSARGQNEPAALQSFSPGQEILDRLAAACEVPRRCTDHVTYGGLLWECLTEGALAGLTSRKQTEVVQLFLAYWDGEYCAVHAPALPDAEEEAARRARLVPGARRMSTKKVTGFLRVFAGALTNPSHIKNPFEQRVREVLLELLGKSDPKVQGLALASLCQWKPEYLVPYRKRLERLIGDGTFREEMTLLGLSREEGDIRPEHRARLVPLLIRVMMPKVLHRHTPGAKTTLAGRRAAVFAYFSSLRPVRSELGFVLRMLLKPFFGVLRKAGADLGRLDPDEAGGDAPEAGDGMPGAHAAAVAAATGFVTVRRPDRVALRRVPLDLRVPLDKQVGFLRMLGVLLKQLKNVVRPYLPVLLTVVLHILHEADATLKGLRTDRDAAAALAAAEAAEGDEDEDEGAAASDDADEAAAPVPAGKKRRFRDATRELRSARQLSFDAVAAMIDNFDGFPFKCGAKKGDDALLDLFLANARPSIERLATEGAQNRGGLLNALVSASRSVTLARRVFVDAPYRSVVLPSLASTLAAPHASQGVVAAVLDALENLLHWSPDAPEGDESDSEEEDEDEAEESASADESDSPAAEDSGSSSDDDDDDTAMNGARSHITVTGAEVAAEEVDPEVQLMLGDMDKLWPEYVEQLVRGLAAAMQRSAPAGASHGRGQRRLPYRELAVVSRLSRYSRDPALARQMVDLMLPLLRRPGTGRAMEAAKVDMLLVIRTMIPLLEEPSTVVSFLSHQLLTLQSPRARRVLGLVFVRLGRRIEELRPVAALLRDLNAMVEGRIAEPDFERRAAAVRRLEVLMFPEADAADAGGSARAAKRARREAGAALGVSAATPVLYTLLHDMMSADTALRGNAAHMVRRIVCAGEPAEGERPSSLVTDVVYPVVRKALRGHDEAVRREFVLLLAHLARRYPAHFSDLAGLLSDNADLDFFENVVHIQLHRRRRALARLRAGCEEGVVPPRAATSVLLPLVGHFIYEASASARAGGATDGRATHKSSGAAAAGQQHALLEEAVRAVGALAALLPWGGYRRTLMSFVKQIPLKPELEKVLVRVVCMIVDGFRFKVVDSGAVPVEDADMADASTAGDDEKTAAEEEEKKDGDDAEDDDDADDDDAEDDDDDDDDEAAEDDEAEAIRVCDAIMGQVLPQMHRLLTQEETRSVARGPRTAPGGKSVTHFTAVRVPVAMAIVRLLRKLPERLFQAELPRLLLVLVNQLSRRDQTGRDVTRRTLVDVLATVGPRYMDYILRQLRESLTRGYQLHVLGYTVHALLQGLTEGGAAEPGCLDGCVGTLADVLREDLFGEAATQKEQVLAIRQSMREAHRVKAYESFGLAARHVTFDPHVVDLIAPLRAAATRSDNLHVVRKVEEALRHVADGLSHNPTVASAEGAPALLVYSFKLASESLDAVEALRGKRRPGAGEPKAGKAPASSRDIQVSRAEMRARLKVTKEETMMVQAAPTKRSRLNLRHNSNTMLWFSLVLVRMAFRRRWLNAKDPAMAGMLDPFVPLLRRCCTKSSPNQVVDLALRLTHSMLLAASSAGASSDAASLLPSVPKHAGPFAKFVFQTLHRGNKELTRPCFRALATLVRHCPYFELSEAQARSMLSYVERDLTSSGSGSGGRQALAFTLLRALLSRRVLLPEVYDLMTHVAELMVQSAAPSVRQGAAGAFLQFLLDYPLGQKRVRQHLGFLLNNLSYPHPSGRIAVLDLLAALVTKLPELALAEHADLLFFPLVLDLVNDDSAKCRQLAGEVIKAFLGRLPAAKVAGAMKYVVGWFAPPAQQAGAAAANPVLRRAAAQLSGIAAQTLGQRFQRYLEPLAAHAATVLAECLEEEEALADNFARLLAAEEAAKRREDSAVANFFGAAQTAEGLAMERAEEAASDEDEDPADAGFVSGGKVILRSDDGEEEEEEDDADADAADAAEDQDQDAQKGAGDAAGDALPAPLAAGAATSDAVRADQAWRLAYYTLLFLERAQAALPSLVEKQMRKGGLWDAVTELLQHRHTWVRLAAGRVVARYFAQLDAGGSGWLDEGRIGQTLVGSPERLYAMAKVFCTQLESPLLDDNPQVADLAARNLLFSCLSVARMPRFAAAAPGNEDEDAAAAAGGDADGPEPGNRALRWLLRRVSYMSRKEGCARRMAVFRIFVALSGQLPPEDTVAYLVIMLNPLYRAANADDRALQTEDARRVKTFAQEAMEAIQERVGSRVYLDAYNSVHKRVYDIRASRKRARTVEAVLDPQRHARRKQAKNLRKRTRHREKMDVMRNMRTSGVAGPTPKRKRDDEE